MRISTTIDVEEITDILFPNQHKEHKYIEYTMQANSISN